MERPGGPIFFLVFCEQTAFFKLDSLFPECYLYREQMPRTDPLMCLHSACPANHGCMDTLSKRVFTLFQETIPQVDLLILYFRKQCTLGLGAGLFWKDMREPRLITMNPSAWEFVKTRGLVFEFRPGAYFFLSGTADKPAEQPDGTKAALDLPSRPV